MSRVVAVAVMAAPADAEESSIAVKLRWWWNIDGINKRFNQSNKTPLFIAVITADGAGGTQDQPLLTNKETAIFVC